MKKTIWTFGLISGFIVATFMSATMIMNKDKGCGEMEKGLVIGFSIMIVAFSMIFVGIRNYRNKHNGGTITFGKALMMGLYMSLIASTMYVLTWAFVYHTYMPDFMEKYSEYQKTELLKQKTDAAKLEAELKELATAKENYKNPVWFSLYTYMEILPVGIIISLISAAILTRKKLPQEPQAA